MPLNYFGTDGVRGRAFESPLRLSDVSRWGQAFAGVARGEGITKLVLGWDPRTSSDPLAQAFLQGLGSFETIILGMVPTPAVAWVTQQTPAAWGVMLSASHNPPEDNGIKGFDQLGEKLTEDLELRLEEAFEKASVADSSLPLLHSEQDPVERYLAHLGTVDLPEGFSLVVDCAHGATAPFAPRVLLGDVHWIGVPADGARINVRVGSTHLGSLQKSVRTSGADLGIGFDGDGDRCLLVDPDGVVVDGDQMMLLLALDRLARGEILPGVVGTLMTNGALEEILKSKGVGFIRTPVGDKFMLRELARQGWDLAAEASGHLIQKHLGPSGDGLATAISVLKALLRRPTEKRWDWRFTPWPLRLVNLVAQERIPIERCGRLMKTMRELEFEHGDALRLVIRWSGTEPKLRLMVEARTEALLSESMARLESAGKMDLGLE